MPLSSTDFKKIIIVNYKKLPEIEVSDKEIKTQYYNYKDIIFIKPHNYINHTNSIVILEYNNLYFSIGRIYIHNNKKIAIVYCYNKTNTTIIKLMYYTSISDDSFWKYCIKPDEDSKFVKGYNYVSSTFVNIDIQQFIEDEKKCHIIDTTPPDSYITMASINSELINRINGKPIINNNFFDAMNFLFPRAKILLNYPECISKLLTELEIHTKNNDIFNINLYSNIYCKFKNKNINHDTHPLIFFKEMILILYDVFFEYYTIDHTTIKILYVKEFTINGIIRKMIIKQCTIINNSDSTLYTLFYGIINNENRQRLGKIILHIIPINIRINNYGLDMEYIPAGALINKLFYYFIDVDNVIDCKQLS